MSRRITGRIFLSILTFCFGGLPCGCAEETPQKTIERAIREHGGNENLAKTLIGTVHAKATMSLSPEFEAAVTWRETFELPKRYHRIIKGTVQGKDFSMEYAVTDGKGWTRENDGEIKDYEGPKTLLDHNWNSLLGTLPGLLSKDVKLESAGKDVLDGREVVGVRVSGDSIASGKGILYFDCKTGLLVKSSRRTIHPLTGKDVDIEVVCGNYKEVSGVKYPYQFTSIVDGKKIIEMEITKVEFLKKLDDHLFEKP